MRIRSTLTAALVAAIGGIALCAQPALAQTPKTFTLKYHHSYPPSLAFYNKVGAGFIEQVERWSNGRIKFETFNAGALTSVAGQLEAVNTGIIDVSQSWGGFYVGDVPEADIEVGLPLAWRNSWEVYDAYYNRGLAEVMQQAYAKKFNVQHFPAIIGMQYGISTRQEVKQLSDLKGLKIRALGVYGEFVQALGASAVVVPGPELNTALQLGTIDGLVYGAEAVVAQGLQADLKTTMIEPNFNAGSGHWLINGDTWKSLPADLQRVIADAARYGNAATANDYRVIEAKSVGVLVKDGVTMLSMSDADSAKTSEIAQGLWEKVSKRSDLAAKGVEIVRTQQREFGNIK